MSTIAEADTTPPPPAKQTPVWEDIPDIFFEPKKVYERRRDGRFGKALLILLLVFLGLGAATTFALWPAQRADSARMSARFTQGNPAAQEALREQASRPPGTVSAIFGGIGMVFMMAISIFLVGFGAWLLGKIFGSAATFGAAVMIATYAFYPRILQQIVMILQGLFMDPAQLDSMTRVTISPARFLDPDTSSMMAIMMLARLDLFVLWSTVLIGIGIYVVGRVSKVEAALTAALVWIIAALPGIAMARFFGS